MSSFLALLAFTAVLLLPEIVTAQSVGRTSRSFGGQRIRDSFSHNQELSDECARLDCTKDVLRSRNQDLLFNRFGYDKRSRRRPSSELTGYGLEDTPANAVERLAKSSAVEEDSGYEASESAGDRFNRYVQSASSTLVSGFGTVFQQWLGGEPAYAAEESSPETFEESETERDGLVHF